MLPEATDPARDPITVGGITPNVSWGDVDYQGRGQDYATRRRADPRIATQVHRALGSARTVLNVGAGSGSYEPADRYVLAVEPSPAMRAHRPAHLAPAIDAVAEHLPLDDRSVDAAMATLTVHQWSDPAAGLAELRRVAHGPVVILTFDPDALDRFWLADYAPELIQVERHRYPPIEAIRSALGDHTDLRPIPIPIDCRDGFTEAYYARPDRLLDPGVRRAQSAWAFVDPGAERRFVAALGADLTSGTWDRRYGAWRSQPQFDGSLRLILGHPPTMGRGRAYPPTAWRCRPPPPPLPSSTSLARANAPVVHCCPPENGLEMRVSRKQACERRLPGVRGCGYFVVRRDRQWKEAVLTGAVDG